MLSDGLFLALATFCTKASNIIVPEHEEARLFWTSSHFETIST